MRIHKTFTLVVLVLAVGTLLSFLMPLPEADCHSLPKTDDQEIVPVTAQLLVNVKQIEAGKPFKLSVFFRIQPHWYIYYKDPGDVGMPTQINWNLPPGFTASSLDWPRPETFNDSGVVTRGYRNKAIISTTVMPPMDLKGVDTANLSATIKWLSCKNICLPGSTTESISLPVASSISNSVGLLNSDFIGGALMYVFFAFVGGVILNFMPCVLPVIAIKLISLLEEGQGLPRQIRLLGATFACGIVVSFLSLAGIVVAMKAAGHEIGWGFQFQYPGFLVGMSVIVTLMALSFFGMFYVPVFTGQSTINNLADREGMVGTFFKGVMATTLSTPCTAPFLGTALGFAFAQPWWIICAIFLAIGLGMSFPYLLLTAKPEWICYLPKPGVWMEKLKEAMGFLLLGTVVWLLYVLGSEVGITGVILTVAFLICVSFNAWIVSRFIDLSSGLARRTVIWSIVLLVGGLSFYWLIGSQFDQFTLASNNKTSKHASISSSNCRGPARHNGLDWETFSWPALNRHLAQGDGVLLDFTADWCLTCQLNERTVLSSKAVVDKIRALHMVPMRADWTKQDPDVTQLLTNFRRSGVPLYVIFPAHHMGGPIVLPEILTEAILLDKLDQSIAQVKSSATE